MAERHRVHETAESVEEEAAPVAASTPPEYHQEHTVPEGGMVTIHGGIFEVKDGVYHWHVTDPHKDDVMLQNATSSDPTFFAMSLGTYTARLTTVHGRAEFLFHVIPI